MLQMRKTGRVLVCALMLGIVASAEQDDPDIASFESLIKAKQFLDASRALQVYTDAHPQSWQALYQLGYSDFMLHRMQDSVTALCKSIVLHPKFAESHKVLAYDLNLLGHQDLAVHELELAIAYNPQSAESHYELGRISYEQGAYLKAVQLLERAQSLDPSSVRTYHNLGLAYSAIGDHDQAVKSFDEGLRLNALQPHPSAWPLIDYATYCNMQSNCGKARDLLLQAIQISDKWDQAFEELSKAFRGLGQTTEAIDALQKAVLLNPGKAEYHYALARLYTQTHQLAQANQQLAEYQTLKSRQQK